METLRIGPGVPRRRQAVISVAEVAARLVLGLAVGVGLGVGLTVWVAVASLL